MWGIGGLGTGGMLGYAFFFLWNSPWSQIRTVFIPMYTWFFSPKDRGEEKCAKVPCSHCKKRWKENVIEKKEMFCSSFIQQCDGFRFSTFHIPKGWLLFLLHLSFLAILLHFLLQFFLFLWRAVLLFPGLPASLPVKNKRQSHHALITLPFAAIYTRRPNWEEQWRLDESFCWQNVRPLASLCVRDQLGANAKFITDPNLPHDLKSHVSAKQNWFFGVNSVKAKAKWWMKRSIPL